ncbi:MAG: plastocyanin/azurin family copper-binding protein [Chloroflexota bacterium]
MSDHSATHGPRRRATLAALAALIVVLAACTATSTTSTTSEPPASLAAASQAAASQAPSAAASEAAAGGTTVTLSGLAFSVAEITVPVGKVTFVNEDSVAHVLAEGENGVEVDSPRVQKVSVNGGSQGDMQFTVAGDYHITCLVHPTMNMEVHVQ